MQERFLWLLAALAALLLVASAARKHLADSPGDTIAAQTTVASEPVQRPALRSSSPIRVEVLNGCGAPSVAGRVTRRARALGLDVIDEGNAESFGFLESMVIDRRGSMDRARAVAAVLGIPGCIQQIGEDRSRLAEVSVVVGRDHDRLHLSDPAPEPASGPLPEKESPPR